MGRDRSVGIATRYGLDGPGIESRCGARFSAPFQTGPGAHQASYTMGTGSFPGVKRPGRVVNHSPPSSAEVKERVELYLYSPFGPSWPVIGWPFTLLLLFLINSLKIIVLCCFNMWFLIIFYVFSFVVCYLCIFLTFLCWFGFPHVRYILYPVQSSCSPSLYIHIPRTIQHRPSPLIYVFVFFFSSRFSFSDFFTVLSPSILTIFPGHSLSFDLNLL